MTKKRKISAFYLIYLKKWHNHIFHCILNIGLEAGDFMNLITFDSITDEITEMTKKETLVWIKSVLEKYIEIYTSDMHTYVNYIDLCIDSKVSVGEARKKAFEIHAKARNSKAMNEKNLYRAIAHGIATYHVKEHALKSMYYLKKIK